jgi:hypothetical protein
MTPTERTRKLRDTLEYIAGTLISVIEETDLEPEPGESPVEAFCRPSLVGVTLEFDGTHLRTLQAALPVAADALAADEGTGDLRAALYACRRAMAGARDGLTETARREVHMHLSAELNDQEAAAEWHEATIAPVAADEGEEA